MPLLVLLLGLQLATPLVGFATLTTISLILWREWRNIDIWAARQLLVASLFGVPCGLWLFNFAPAKAMLACLGVLLLAYSLFSLARPTLPRLASARLVYVFGFVSGVLGSAYNVNGPPVVIYGALAQWSPQRFRATLQGYFLPASIIICCGHGLSGLWSREVFILYGWSLPAIVVGNWLGAALARLIPLARFERMLYGLLAVLGLLLLI